MEASAMSLLCMVYMTLVLDYKICTLIMFSRPFLFHKIELQPPQISKHFVLVFNKKIRSFSSFECFLFFVCLVSLITYIYASIKANFMLHQRSQQPRVCI